MTTVLLYWQVCNELLARYFKPVVDEVVEKVEEDSAVAVDEGEIEGEHDGSASSFCFFNLENSTAALVA